MLRNLSVLDETGEVGGCFVQWVHSLERDPLIRPVPERQVVLVNTYFVNPPVRLDGTDDLPLLPATILDQFFGSVPGVKEHRLYDLWARGSLTPPASGVRGHTCCDNANVC